MEVRDDGHETSAEHEHRPLIPIQDVTNRNSSNLPTLASALSLATDKTISFLSTASTEQLVLCAAGLGATTYVVLGRVGLILIGALGGVVLHATWEAKNQHGDADEHRVSGEVRRREAGVEVARRLLDWTRSKSRYDSIGQPGKVGGFRSGVDFFGLPTEIASSSVSYTHLTLPTIYSV